MVTRSELHAAVQHVVLKRHNDGDQTFSDIDLSNATQTPLMHLLENQKMDLQP